MAWITLSVAAVIVVLLIRVWLKPPGETADRYEFEASLHDLLLSMKDGATMTVSHRDSPLYIRFRRDRGLYRRCDLLVDVPRADWSEPRLDALREHLDRKCIDGVESPDEPGVLLRVRLHVPDVWAPASGAAGARVAWELFEVLGLNEGARFKLASTGEHSARAVRSSAEDWKRGKNPLLRWVARSCMKDFEEEDRAQHRAQHRDSNRSE